VFSDEIWAFKESCRPFFFVRLISKCYSIMWFWVPLFGRKRDRPENRVEQLLLAGANDVTARQRFLIEFVDSDIFCIGEIKGPNVQVEGEHSRTAENTEVSIAAFDHKGERITAAYTSLDRMREALGDGFRGKPWFSTKARNVLKAIHPQSRMVLNWGCTFGKEFTHHEIQLLLEGRSKELDTTVQVQARTEYESRPATEPPQAFLDQAWKYFTERGDIQEAYLAEVRAASLNEPWHPMIGVRVRDRKKTRFGEIVADLDRIGHTRLAQGVMMDIVEITPEETRDRRFAGIEPFYRHR